MATNTDCNIESFSTLWTSAINATYTFCRNASLDCGGTETMSKMVYDPTFEPPQQRQLFYFYTAQPTSAGISNCMDINVPDKKYVWAAASPLSASQDLSSSSRRLTTPRRSSWITFLALFLLALQLVPIASAATLNKRDTECQKFVPSGVPRSTFTNSIRLSDDVDCTNAATSCYVLAQPDILAQVGSEYSLAVSPNSNNSNLSNPALPSTFITDSFNTTKADQYSLFLRPSSFIALSIPIGQKGFLASFRPADLYNGQLQDCNDGNTYNATFIGPTGDFIYNIVAT